MKFITQASLAVLIVAPSLFNCTSTESIHSSQSENFIVPLSEIAQPYPDPRIGLGAGLFDAEEAIWNLRLVSTTPPPADFIGAWGTDLAFKDNFAIQGNYNGFIVWDISDPANPVFEVDYLCPASQSDVSVYGDLLFVSGEGLEGRLDCGTQGVRAVASEERLRGIRIFDISDIRNPEYIANVQTCRGSHTHSVLVDPNDDENIYVYVSGSAPVRPEEELPGCSALFPDEDPESALFRIEIIKVPLANPELAAIANSPRIFEGLEAPPTRGLSPEEQAEIDKAREEGRFVAEMMGQERVIPDGMIRQFLSQIVREREGSGIPTAADSIALKERLPQFIDNMLQARGRSTVGIGPNQCHDITLYPEIGLAGGACEGYGLLIDITDPLNPVRIDAVADSNFAYWHSATFNNDGTTILFTDEWGGGTQAKCRDIDPYEWGANAIYTITEDGTMEFQSYFKMPAVQTETENCVAHNGSLIPVPGRDIMVQSWYQGGINVFDFTDPKNPVEIAFHDRGPISADRLEVSGSWSIYWYNGYLINSEMSRGLDVFELLPSDFITQNELDAANTVRLDYFNPQGQPKFSWPSSFALARAYTDQLERNREASTQTLQLLRAGMANAERAAVSERNRILSELASQIENGSAAITNGNKAAQLADVFKDLAGG